MLRGHGVIAVTAGAGLAGVYMLEVIGRAESRVMLALFNFATCAQPAFARLFHRAEAICGGMCKSMYSKILSVGQSLPLFAEPLKGLPASKGQCS